MATSVVAAYAAQVESDVLYASQVDVVYAAMHEENRALWQMNYRLERLNDELSVENRKRTETGNDSLEAICELRDMVKSLRGRNTALERRMAATDAAENFNLVENIIALERRMTAMDAAEAARMVEEKAVKKAAKWKERMERKMVAVIAD